MRPNACVILLATLVALASPADAQTVQYPWCAIYGSDMSGATNCGFVSLAQCRETIAGMGGFCEPNLMYSRETTGRASLRVKRGKAAEH